MTDEGHSHTEMDDRLEQLEARIQFLEAERAERMGGGAGPKYYETGNIHPELDDPSITP